MKCELCDYLMKNNIVIVLSLLFIIPISGIFTPSYANDGLIIDGTVSIATEPSKGFGNGLGFGVGFGMDVTNKTSIRSGRLIARGDIHYYKWDTSVFGVDVTLTRMPVFLGARYYVPVKAGSLMALYAEGGLELSFDKSEAAACAGALCVKESASETNIGIAPGAGVEFPLGQNLSLGANIRLHMISDSYLSIGASIGHRF